MSLKKRIYKLFHWEFWNVYMFYIPNLYYALYYAFIERSLTFFTLTNPGIDNGGLGTESKHDTLKLIPSHLLPKTVFHSSKSNIDTTCIQLAEKNVSFPIIAKPDIGFRGLLVKKINSEFELKEYLLDKPIDFILQEFIEYPNECGIFFIRHPKESIGKITSITLKECPNVIGNGNDSIQNLVQKDKHLSLFEKQIRLLTNKDFNYVPKANELVELSSIGNHSKGTKFINGNNLISKQLTTIINEVNLSIKGWYYGRLDIKYDSWEEVEKGNFKVIELNGVLGEPTHIYDTSKMSYFKALKTMRIHWKQLYLIASYHHREMNTPYKKASELIKDLKFLKKYTKKVKELV